MGLTNLCATLWILAVTSWSSSAPARASIVRVRIALTRFTVALPLSLAKLPSKEFAGCPPLVYLRSTGRLSLGLSTAAPRSTGVGVVTDDSAGVRVLARPLAGGLLEAGCAAPVDERLDGTVDQSL